MSEALAPIQLFEALPDLLPDPRIMIEIILHKLLDITIGIAAVLRCDAVQFHLKVGIEMYFHRPSRLSFGPLLS